MLAFIARVHAAVRLTCVSECWLVKGRGKYGERKAKGGNQMATNKQKQKLLRPKRTSGLVPTQMLGRGLISRGQTARENIESFLIGRGPPRCESVRV